MHQSLFPVLKDTGPIEGMLTSAFKPSFIAFPVLKDTGPIEGPHVAIASARWFAVSGVERHRPH